MPFLAEAAGQPTARHMHAIGSRLHRDHLVMQVDQRRAMADGDHGRIRQTATQHAIDLRLQRLHRALRSPRRGTASPAWPEARAQSPAAAARLRRGRWLHGSSTSSWSTRCDSLTASRAGADRRIIERAGLGRIGHGRAQRALRDIGPLRQEQRLRAGRHRDCAGTETARCRRRRGTSSICPNPKARPQRARALRQRQVVDAHDDPAIRQRQRHVTERQRRRGVVAMFETRRRAADLLRLDDGIAEGRQAGRQWPCSWQARRSAR